MQQDEERRRQQDDGQGGISDPSRSPQTENGTINSADSQRPPDRGNDGIEEDGKPSKNFLSRLTLSEWLTFLVGFGSLLVAILGLVNSLDTSDMRKAVSNISNLATQSKRQVDEAYRPWVYAQFVSVGDFTITDKDVTASLTFRFANEGTLPANDVEAQFDFMPIDAAMRQQGAECREAAIFQSLHLKDSAKQGITGVYDTIPQREAWPTDRSFSATVPVAKFKNTNAYATRQGWLATPAMVGCIVYFGADGVTLHHTRVLYWFRDIGSDGQRTFIEAKPQTIPAAKVAASPWIDYGNSQD